MRKGLIAVAIVIAVAGSGCFGAHVDTDYNADASKLLQGHPKIPATAALAIPQAQKDRKDSATKLGIKVTAVRASASAQDLETRLVAVGEQIDAIHAMAGVPVEPLMALANKLRLPVFPTQRIAVDAGALLSYGGKLEEQYRGAAVYIDKILKGVQPGDLPVQEPARYELVINLKAARMLGIAIPAVLLTQADELIE